MKSNRLFQLLALVMVAAFVLASCSPAATAAPTAAPTQAAAAPTAAPAQATTAPTDWSKATSAADGGGMDALVKAAQAEGNLTVITLPRDWCDYGDMMDNFTAKYGIKIQDVNPDGGSADEVQAIKTTNRTKVRRPRMCSMLALLMARLPPARTPAARTCWPPTK